MSDSGKRGRGLHMQAFALRLPFQRSLRAGFVLAFLSAVLSQYAMVPVSAPGGWNTEDVTTTGDVGWWASIAVDSQNNVYISYSDWTIPALRLATWTGSSWSIQTVDPSSTTEVTSLAIDSMDRPHIVYRDYLNNDTKYAYWTGSSWNIEVADSENQSGLRVSIAIDSNDSPHISYYSNCDNGKPPLLRYANRTGGSWHAVTVHEVGVCGLYDSTSIALDSKDRPHIAYGGTFSHDLLHANWTGSSWNLEVVDSSAVTTGNFASIAIDSNDYPHISYYSGYNISDLMYARYAPLGGADWMIETVHSGPVGMFTSLVLDSQDRPHISYTSDTSGPATHDLYYAHFVGSWALETIDTDWVVGKTSMVVDKCGIPHVAYMGAPSGIEDADLRHAWKICTNPLPDLAVQSQDISFLPSNRVSQGTNVMINATIYNDGIADASDVLVRIYEGDPITGSQIDGDKNLSLIPWGDSASVEVSWNASSVGTHDICVVVDPEHTIDELSELNNEACATIQVYSPQPPAPPNMLEAYLTGVDSEHVTMTWSLSPDDLGGLRNVVRYDILRGEQYSSDLAGYPVLDSASSGTSMYVDEYAGEGDPNNYFYVACAVNAIENQSCAGNQAGKFTRPLSQGPSLISIPLIQSDEGVETVLQTVEYDKAWFYDTTSPGWKWHMTYKEYRRGLYDFNHTMGMWISVTQNSNLTVAGIVPAQTTIHLYQGWNLVSFPSFNSSYTVYDLGMDTAAARVEGYDPTPPYHLRVLGDTEVLLAGSGYWVKVEADVSWTVNVG